MSITALVAATTILLLTTSPIPATVGGAAPSVQAMQLNRSDGHLMLATTNGLYEASLWVPNARVIGPVGGRPRNVTAVASLDQSIYISGRIAPTRAPSPAFGLVSSTDHGDRWESAVAPTAQALHSLVIERLGGKARAFALTPDGLLVRDSEDGRQWVRGAVRGDAIGVSNGWIYLATDRGVRVSQDGCVFTPPIGPKLSLLIQGRPSDAALIGLGRNGRLWRLDEGAWMRAGRTPSDTTALGAALYEGEFSVLAAASGAVWRSTDWGRTWSKAARW